MKNYHLTFVLAICIALMSIIGCGDTYDEGDEVAKQSFNKMTSQEKIIYNAVQMQWGQRRLKSIREAISTRESKPSENNLAFQDIAAVIKTNNNVTLTLESNWTVSQKNSCIMSRWDRIDEDWYRKLLSTIGIKDIVYEEPIPEEKVIEEKKAEQEEIKTGSIAINGYIDEHPEVVAIDIKDIIPESKYDDLYYEIKNCDNAVFRYKQIISERLLTWQDYELLIRISIKCKAIKIGEKFE